MGVIRTGGRHARRAAPHRRGVGRVDLEDAKCVPCSAETYEELRTFVHGERGKMGGQPGRHDDRVMALSLANVAARQPGVGDIVIL